MSEFEGVPEDSAVEPTELEPTELEPTELEPTDLEDDVLLLEEVDTELVLPVWQPTGEPRVDAALEVLTTLDPDDVHQHAAVFEDIHQQLRGTLTDLDSPA